MFMKIFIVLIIISFNNIFTIPSNINNDKTTIQLIRTKRQSDKIYNFEIKGLKKVKFLILKNNNQLFVVNIDKKDNINLNEKIPEIKDLDTFTFWFTKEFENSQSKQKKLNN
ncbi:hypothetical protein [Spiroplasma endosymbiont of Agriotes lineatus]|uniref:hypothetical protein n=1 Tax=Spiroplasma endosymbiont of Agriotes lineatus TaxID=3077930 RepID=UPI0030CD24A6